MAGCRLPAVDLSATHAQWLEHAMDPMASLGAAVPLQGTDLAQKRMPMRVGQLQGTRVECVAGRCQWDRRPAEDLVWNIALSLTLMKSELLERIRSVDDKTGPWVRVTANFGWYAAETTVSIFYSGFIGYLRAVQSLDRWWRW